MYNENQIRINLAILFVRYKEVGETLLPEVNQKLNITGLAIQALEQIDTISLFKLNRWLGYLQGTLIGLGVLSIDGERDFTRPLLSPFDE